MNLHHVSLPLLGVSASVPPSEGGSPSLHLTVPFPLGPPDGSAVFRGCFPQARQPLPGLARGGRHAQRMSVDKCVDFCTEKVSLLSHGIPGGGQCGAESWRSEMLGWGSSHLAALRKVLTATCDAGGELGSKAGSCAGSVSFPPEEVCLF